MCGVSSFPERQDATRQCHATAPNGQRVALKILSTEAKEDSAWLRRFLMEEWIARRLDSSNELKPAPAPESRSSLYVLTEFVERQTLRQWMADQESVSLIQFRGIMGQAIGGLRAFHRKQMLHQDLRPENLMIDADGTVKIIDCGVTRVEHPKGDRAKVEMSGKYLSYNAW
ncbi:protein kinase domain-containing protein [Aliiruegeria lutimaris]|uniref:Protein kinase domain-containing protein n=1 Tax=Aliiruegeria lutimaris TaxID=571298 RepID=A0A1G8SM23_9RHOB|nr:protein kinase [Aliiruegeria lutimaris]SDJ30306.1 Protein kinase domain-containing protein [Aliiruegeria lutimaris]